MSQLCSSVPRRSIFSFFFLLLFTFSFGRLALRCHRTLVMMLCRGGVASYDKPRLLGLTSLLFLRLSVSNTSLHLEEVKGHSFLMR